MKTLLITLSLLVSASSFAATGGGSSVGTGNPAAQKCVDIGGTLERTVKKEGEDANCVIDEWKLFQEMERLHLVKPTHCRPDIGCMANPAAKNCQAIDGEYRIVNGEGGEAGYCVVEQWKLFKILSK
ncbi:MAG: DUF333 domain-containing protein [Bdellovibrionota bacterium]